MGVPNKFYTFVDSQTASGLINAARLNGNFDPLFACLDPASGGLEDTNVKSGAKITCSDRNYVGAAKITGAWEFSAFPTVPDASIPAAKLPANLNADTVDGQHASEFAPVAKGVTNGDSHDHIGGDGAAITEATIALADNTTGDVSITKHGFAPKAPNDVTKFLRGDATWASLQSYTLPVISRELPAPADGTTYWLGGAAVVPDTVAASHRIYIPKAGTITAAYVFTYAATAGSNENISVYIRKNGSAQTLIQTVGAATNARLFSNTGLSISVVAGDYIAIEMVCPTWATDPLTMLIGGTVLVEA